MLRVKIWASAIPLALAGVVAGNELVPSAQPCIALSGISLQIATGPWQSQLRVSFTDDPAAATVRVQLVDRADIADFVVTDDIDTADAESCGATNQPKFVGITTHATATEPVIYLSQDGGADYRIFVQSRTFSAHDAAALVVGAGRGIPTQKMAAL